MFGRYSNMVGAIVVVILLLVLALMLQGIIS